jgi:hypothetical protein
MQTKIFLLLFMIVYGTSALAQSNPNFKKSKAPDPDFSRFAGTYEMETGIIHFTVHQGALVLIVPGAPIQKLKLLGKNTFKSTISTDLQLVFTEDQGTITGVVSTEHRGTFKGKKITNDQVKILSLTMDSILVLSKSSAHFTFLYSPIDSISVDTIASDFERNYNRILKDFKLERLPRITVRIYPDLNSFHKGINFPTASNQVLATAFGKDDIRMVSPNNAGPESWMLVHFAPHEFTHCVHLNIDYSPNNPAWLWEGVAQYEAKWFFDPKEFEFMRSKEFPHLADLRNGMEYMLGFVIIEAINDIWGFDVVLSLIKNQGDIQKVLKIKESEFEEKVFASIYKKYLQN